MKSTRVMRLEPAAERGKLEAESRISVDPLLNNNIGAYARNQAPTIIWFTGLSGAGKTTTASLLERKLTSIGCGTYLLDGDVIRKGLCKDLGFSDQDRIENIRRVGEVAKLMIDAGLIVLASFISPFQRDRDLVRSMVAKGEFIECHVKASLEVCEQRDPKGLYKKARSGELKNFTGVDSLYEKPLNPELVIDTELFSPEELVDKMVDYLKANGVIQ